MSSGFPDEFPFNRRYDRQPFQAPTQQVEANEAIDGAEDEELSEAPTIACAADAANLAAVELAPTPRVAVQSAPGIERRRSVRQTLVARATIRPETNFAGIGPMAAGYLSNISLKGVGLHTRRPLVVGERYLLKLEVGPMRWQSRVKVVTCQPHASGTYDVGAEFIANELQVRAPRDLAA